MSYFQIIWKTEAKDRADDKLNHHFLSQALLGYIHLGSDTVNYLNREGYPQENVGSQTFYFPTNLSLS